MAKEAPLFVMTHDMLDWLTPHLETWPRPQRFLLARQVMECATSFYRMLVRARKVEGQARAAALLDADAELETLKAMLRLGQERRYMSLGQYAHVARMLTEIGQQLGGWRKSTQSRLAQSTPP